MKPDEFMKKSEPIDLLLVTPGVDIEKDHEKILTRRIEEGVGNQESPHIGFGYLIAMAKRHGLNARTIDMPVYKVSVEQLVQYIERSKPKIVGFSAFTIQIKGVGYIAEVIKKRCPETLVCVGGSHVTVMPMETLAEFPAIDFVVAGEGELALKEAFNQIENSSNLTGIRGLITPDSTDCCFDHIDPLDSLPFPSWDEFDLSEYPGLYPHRTRLELPMSTSRGCPFSCVFCVRHFGRKRRNRSVESVIGEIERNIAEYGCQSISFVDETFIFNIDWSTALFEEMIRKDINKKINWSCSTRVDNMSPQLFNLIRRAGCYYVFFGFENGDDGILKNISKRFSVSDIRRAVKWAKDAGLIVVGSFIIGLPGETKETVMRSINLARDLDIYSTTFPIAVPFPGTEIREMALKGEYGMRILSNDWNDYGKQYPGVMDSEDLSIEERRNLQALAYQMLPKKKLPETASIS